MRKLRLVKFAFVAVIAAASAVALFPSPAGAMQNGDAITSAPPWAAYVTTVSKFFWTQTQESSCTGSVVAYQWVLTAAHCAVVDDKNGLPTSTAIDPSKFRVVLGRSNLSNTAQGAQYT